MRSLRRLVLIALSTAVMSATVAEIRAQDKPAQRPRRRPNSVFAPVKDNPALPQVLLIGDSISIGYTAAVRGELAGKANVHRAPTNCGPTIRGLEQLGQWLGEERWDVIHFNWGLHHLTS